MYQGKDWVCDLCAAALEKPPLCRLCGESGVGMKRDEGGEHWVHVTCAVWIPETSLKEVESGVVVAGVLGIAGARWRLTCRICNRRGACIQCAGMRCAHSFHPLCAYRAGCMIQFEVKPRGM